MPWLLKGGRVAEDPWFEVADDDPLPRAHALISAKRWQGLAAGDTLPSPLGVVLEPEQDLRPLAPSLIGLDLVALRFPKFTDGRPASRARLLRERYGFRGEIRALGDILVDQLQMLQRCGFDSFVLADSQSADLALAELERFTVHFQPGADGRHPLRARRFP